MEGLRVLVVENRANWQEMLNELLRRLGDDVLVDIAATYGKALQQIGSVLYDLAVVDLSLPDDPTDRVGTAERGLALVQALRESRNNQACGVIILTAYPTTERVRRALLDYAVDNFLEKASFSGKNFLEVTRKAIRNARLVRAEIQANNRYRLTVTFSREHLIGTELLGPGRFTTYRALNPGQFAVNDLARRADNLDLLILTAGPDVWRPEAQSIGEAVYAALVFDQQVLGDLVAARTLAPRFHDLWLKFSGPPAGLGVPFELLRDDQDPLALNHIISRRIEFPGVTQTRKPNTFHRFLRELVQTGQKLRALLVAANTDYQLPAVDEEVATISSTMRHHLEQMGIPYDIIEFTGVHANYQEVTDALRNEQFHMFHFAGHDWFDDRLPEASGLVLSDGKQTRILTAANLRLLAQDSDLQIVYLGGCVSARAADRVGRGDFSSAMEAFARADVPTALGFRWTVADAPAMRLAQTFYQTLWRTLSPGEAVLEARRNAAMGTSGRDDGIWASLVMVDQNE